MPASLQDPVTGMRFVLVPGGCYDTGGLDDATRRVCVDPHYLGAHCFQVTFLVPVSACLGGATPGECGRVKIDDQVVGLFELLFQHPGGSSLVGGCEAGDLFSQCHLCREGGAHHCQECKHNRISFHTHGFVVCTETNLATNPLIPPAR